MDPKIIIENLIEAAENLKGLVPQSTAATSLVEDAEETIALARLMLPGLSVPPSVDLSKLSVVINDDTDEIHVFPDKAAALSAAAACDAAGIAARVEVPVGFTPPIGSGAPAQPSPVATVGIPNAPCPSCGDPLNANSECDNCGWTPPTAKLPGAPSDPTDPDSMRTPTQKHRPGSGLAGKSLYDSGSKTWT